jgi:ABC-type transporter Mla subunit MlaD
MPSPAERHRNNVRAGIFVSLAVILTLAVVVILSGAWQSLARSTRPHTVRYSVESGVRNLKPGAQVRVGGLVMGHVTEVRPHFVAGEPFTEIHVNFELSRNVELFADAMILVEAPILGSDAWLDIPSVGTVGAGAPSGGVHDGADSAGLLTTLLGPANAAAAGGAIQGASTFGDYLADLPQEIDPIIDDVKTIAGDVRAISSEVRAEHWPEWAGAIDRVAAWAAKFTEDVDAALAEGRGLLEDGRDILAENRGAVHSALGNVDAASADIRAIAERVRAETVDKVHALLDTGQTALDSATAAIETMRADYETWSVDLGETLGNASLASQQLKLATIEVRRSPWKILYRPAEKELEHELLYDAARSFALAAADLRAASESVSRIVEEHPGALDADPSLRDRVRRNLEDPLEKYEVAQQRLLDVLFADGLGN